MVRMGLNEDKSGGVSRRGFLLMSLGVLAYVPVLEPHWEPRWEKGISRYDLRKRLEDLRRTLVEEEDEEGSNQGATTYLERRAERVTGMPTEGKGQKMAGESGEGRERGREHTSVQSGSLAEPRGLNAILRSRLKPEEVEDMIRRRDIKIWEELTENLIATLRWAGVFGFVTGFTLFGISASERDNPRVRLPTMYDPDEIWRYFLYRPEKVALRTIEVLWNLSSYGAGLYCDLIHYRFRRILDGIHRRAVVQRRKAILRWRERRTHRTPLRNILAEVALLMVNCLGLVSGDGFTSEDPAARKRMEEYWNWRWQRRASLFREAITRLGPAFIKLGQTLATRPDIVGDISTRELLRLQDDMPFFPNKDAFVFIREELGASPHHIFDEISEQPVAAASLGQVYKGSLDGVQVAIKVQRPGIVEQIALDFHVVRQIMLLVNRLIESRTGIVGALDEYASSLFEELDYRNEGRNIAKFRNLYGGMKRIYVPQVFQEYTTTHVLVMEWVVGEKLFDENAGIRKDDIELVELGIACSLTQLLEKGFLHADPHAGNLLRTNDGRLAYIDFGAVSVVPESVMQCILRAILHLVNREYQLLAEDFTGLALMRTDDLEVVFPDFVVALQETLDPEVLKKKYNSSFEGIAETLVSLASRFPLVLPPYFLNNIRALATMEGLALMADPSFSMWGVVYQYVVTRALFDRSPALTSAVGRLIVSRDGTIRWNRLETLLRDAAMSINRSSQINVVPKDLLVDFLASPGGRFLQDVLLSERVKDLTIRVHRFFNNFEAVLLPPKLLPPPQVLELQDDPKLLSRVRRNRVGGRSLFIRARAYRSLSSVRLLPYLLVTWIRGLYILVTVVISRVAVDAVYIFSALRRDMSLRIAPSLEAPTAGLASEPVLGDVPPIVSTEETMDDKDPTLSDVEDTQTTRLGSQRGSSLGR